jgi:hypothetical protein
MNPGNCSGAVYWVVINMVDPAMPNLLANQMMGFFANPMNGWRQVKDINEASSLANRGIVVVAGKPENQPGKHGHVIIVLPGPWKPAGGYMANGSLMPHVGLYPPAMSTAWSSPGSSPWPGAVSNGDKTIYDPWYNREAFRQVTFWTKAK